MPGVVRVLGERSRCSVDVVRSYARRDRGLHRLESGERCRMSVANEVGHVSVSDRCAGVGPVGPDAWNEVDEQKVVTLGSSLSRRPADIGGPRPRDEIGKDREATAGGGLHRRANRRPQLELAHAGCERAARSRLPFVGDLDRGADRVELVTILHRARTLQLDADVVELDPRKGARQRGGLSGDPAVDERERKLDRA